ncbi:tetratricopeptide repeat protein [Sorangium sp. So ce861]|uniref:tetratricopeptide repeat protein n=1 Tax=Sorangium sp. So ce861 TaxID=3133323 RepID=UPI003F5DB48B
MTARRAPFRLPTLCACAALAACGAAPRPASPGAEPPPRHGAAGPPFAERVPLFEGIGSLHHPVTTSSELAQRYFDQGLRLVYAFNHDEARRAFEEAARLDPGLAMARWGVALTLGPNINLAAEPARERAAFEAVAQARALAASATARERAYIEALAERHAATPGRDRTALDRAYASAMRELARRFPDDLDASVLFAEALMALRPWDLWTLDGRPQPGTEEIVSTLEGVLRRDPEHLGANHYYIHAVEASRAPERALPSAERLGGLAPGAGHLVHMPSHIFMRVGRYADASDANERAVLVDRRYIREQRPEGIYPMMYFPHNLYFLSVSASMEGRSAVAVRAARELGAAVPDRHVRHMPMLEMFRPALLFALVRFGLWQDVLAEPAPPSEQRYATGIWRYARGRALASLASTARPDDAAREAAALRAVSSGIAGVTIGRNRAEDLLEIASLVLESQIASARGQAGDAVRMLQAAVRVEDTLRYFEPPDWPEPVRHTLGAALLNAGRPRDAEAVYREDLARNPDNGWSLSGLEQSLRAQGREEESAAAHARFERAFARADVRLSGSRP